MRASKRHAPDVLLAGTVEDLENEAGHHRGTFRLLLHGGPLLATMTGKATEQLQHWTADDVALFRAECLAFLRSLVRGAGHVASSGLGTYETVTFRAFMIGGRAALHASGDVRDLLVLQLTSLLQVAGLHTLRLCPAHGCDRLFVKRHRRKYCSRACQNRVVMKKKRDKDRRERLAWEAANRRRKGRH